MFEIHKNDIYDDIFNTKPYLDNIYNHREYNSTVFYKTIFAQMTISCNYFWPNF